MVKLDMSIIDIHSINSMIKPKAAKQMKACSLDESQIEQ